MVELTCFFVINFGNVNVCIGELGMKVVCVICEKVVEFVDVSVFLVLFFLIGVIGEVLFSDKIVVVLLVVL